MSHKLLPASLMLGISVQAWDLSLVRSCPVREEYGNYCVGHALLGVEDNQDASLLQAALSMDGAAGQHTCR